MPSGVRIAFQIENRAALERIRSVTSTFTQQRREVQATATTIAEAAKAAVAGEVKKREALRASLVEYQALGRAAKSGSEQQIAANRLAMESAHRLGLAYRAAGAEAVAAGRRSRITQEEGGVSRGFLSRASGLGGWIAGPGFIAGAAAGLGATAALREMQREQESQALLRNALQNTTISWNENRKAIERNLRAREKLSGFDKVELRQSLGLLIRGTGSLTQAQHLLAIATDLSRGRHIGLSNAVLLALKAHQGNVGMLRRVGIDLPKVTIYTDALKNAHVKASAEVVKHAKELDKLATARKAELILIQRYGGGGAAYMKTTGGRSAELRNRLRELAITAGTIVSPAVHDLLGWLTKTAASFAEGGKRHEAFVRTLHQVVGGIRDAVGALRTMFRWLNLIVQAMGGWGVAFKLVIAGLLINKFLNLASAIGRSRLALLLLGKTAPVVAAEVVGAEAAIGAGAVVATGRVAALRVALLGLRGPIGLIAAAVAAAGILSPTKPPSLATLQAMGFREVKGKPGVYEKDGHFFTWDGHKLVGHKTEAGAEKAARSGTSLAGFGSIATTAATVAAGGRGRAGHAAGIALAAATSPGHGSTSFHLPGERSPYDCSAFVQAVYRQAGINIGTNTYAQVKQGRRVSRDELRPGDLIFMNFPGETSPGHVGIYVGGNKMVHDHGKSGGVDYQDIPWANVVDLRTYTSGKGSGKITPLPDPASIVAGLPSASHPKKKHGPSYATGAQLTSVRMSIGADETGIAATLRNLHAIGSHTLDRVLASLRARMEKLRHELSQHLTTKQLSNVRQQFSNLHKLLNDQLKKAHDIIASWQGRFKKVWADFAKFALRDFDKVTKEHLRGLQRAFSEQMKAFDRETQRGLLQWAQTPTERLLAARDAAQRTQGLQDALSQAIASGDPAAIKQAQYDIETAQLEAKAAAERLAYDQQAQAYQDQRDALQQSLQEQEQDREDAYQQQRDDQRTALEKMLSDLEAALLAHKKGWRAVGKALGDHFVDGVLAALREVGIDTSILTKGKPKTGSTDDTGGGVTGPVAVPPSHIPRFARGGRVPGQYVGREDTVLAYLTPGEEVTSRADVARNKGMADAAPQITVVLPGAMLLGRDRDVARKIAQAAAPEIARQIGYGSKS